MIEYLISLIRNFLYDYHIHNTPFFYKYVLENHILDNSNILEIGIGNGSCIEYNSDKIKEKKVKIYGIDIDPDYIKDCEYKIKKCNLEDNVSVKYQDLLTLDDNLKYKYIFFTESYPVISEDLMINMLKKCNNLLTEDGEIIFIHNLEKKKGYYRDFWKSNIKYIPFVLVDFGRLTTHDDFNNFIEKTDYKINNKKLIDKVYFRNIQTLLLIIFSPIFIIYPLIYDIFKGNYKNILNIFYDKLSINQYYISCIKK